MGVCVCVCVYKYVYKIYKLTLRVKCFVILALSQYEILRKEHNYEKSE